MVNSQTGLERGSTNNAEDVGAVTNIVAEARARRKVYEKQITAKENQYNTNQATGEKALKDMTNTLILYGNVAAQDAIRLQKFGELEVAIAQLKGKYEKMQGENNTLRIEKDQLTEENRKLGETNREQAGLIREDEEYIASLAQKNNQPNNMPETIKKAYKARDNLPDISDRLKPAAQMNK